MNTDKCKVMLDVWKQECRKDPLLFIVTSLASYLHSGKLFQWTVESEGYTTMAQLIWQQRNYGSSDKPSAGDNSLAQAQEHARIVTSNTLLAVKGFRETVLDSTMGIASLFQQTTYARTVLRSCPAWSPVTAHGDPGSIEEAINSSGHARYGRWYRWPDVLLLGSVLYDAFARTHEAEKEKTFVYRGIDVLMEPDIPKTYGYLFPRDALRPRFMTEAAVDLEGVDREGNNVEMYFVLEFTQPRAFTRFKGTET